MRLLLKSSLILIFSLNLAAQVGTWESLPTLTEIRSLKPLSNKVLMGSNGGLLLFDKSSETFHFGINNKQTQNLDIVSTYIDADSLLWIGSRSPGPIVEVIDLKTDHFLAVEYVDLDEVTSFVQVGDSVYATYQDDIDGGLLLYRKSDDGIKYLDLFNNFPNPSALNLTSVKDVYNLDSKILFRTKFKLLWAELDGRNLKDPQSWNVAHLPVNGAEITALTAHNNSVWLAAGGIIYDYDFESFTTLVDQGDEVTDIAKDPINSQTLLFTTSLGIYSYDIQSGNHSSYLVKSGVTHLRFFADELWMAKPLDFLALFKDTNYQNFSANRPRDHFFNRMVVDHKSRLVGGALGGLSIHSNEGWLTIQRGSATTAFDESEYNWNQMIVETLDYPANAVVEDIVRDKSGHIFVSLQGRGMLKFDEYNPGDSKFYNTAHGALEPTYNSDTYILPGQMALDSDENIWVTTKYVREGSNILSIITPEDSVYHIQQYQNGLDTRSLKCIAIDENDIAWIGAQVNPDLQQTGGLYAVQIVGGDLSDMIELNVSSLMTSSSHLASNDILQLEIAPDNTLWILTPSGVQSMQLPNTWLSPSELRSHASVHMSRRETDLYDYWQLTDYNVTGIEIDQRGNHWFMSSNAGVHCLQENGRWINANFGYNTGNSGLLDNEVYSMTFDSKSGLTYMSTPKGVSILKTPFAEPKEDYSSVHIYPQPFNPDIHDLVVIQGLMDNSSVKILTISGTLVRELSFLDNDVQGYEAQWDGRDQAGDIVGSGVYILYLFNEDGAAASHKLAILR